MATKNKECVTNKCISCNCLCDGTSGGHSCSGCDVCKETDDHTRKD